MHLEVLVEDSSGGVLLEEVLPKLLKEPHTWRVVSYRGIGKIPANLQSHSDPQKRILLDQLPRVLRGYGKTPGIDAVLVVLDTDRRDCKQFLSELTALVAACDGAPKTLFRLAIEEVEAWYFGDHAAIEQAYPRVKKQVLQKYKQDSVCGTWELLADAIYAGGSAKLVRAGWPVPGQVKHEWAKNIAPKLDPDKNVSPSFCKFRDGVRRLVARVEK
jgi:hypothetical protein